MFLWDKVIDTYQIQFIIVNIINPLWTPWQYNIHWLVIYTPSLCLLNGTVFLNISLSISQSNIKILYYDHLAFNCSII